MEVETSGVHNHRATTKAEYVAAFDAAKQALWLGRLAHTFRQVDSDSAPVVYKDTKGVVAVSKNPVHYNTSKHINVRYHFIRDYVISGKIDLEKISPTDNVADGNDQESFGGSFPIPSRSDGRNEKLV